MAKLDRKTLMRIGARRSGLTAAAGEPRATMAGDDTSSWNALVIEDDLDNLDLVLRVLTFYQATVHVACSGQEGLKLLQQLTPTFILLDLAMPGMDGWEVIKRIRSTPATAQLPVIALTAHVMNDTRLRVLASGFDGYISKPFQIADFLGQIRECLKAARRQPVTG